MKSMVPRRHAEHQTRPDRRVTARWQSVKHEVDEVKVIDPFFFFFFSCSTTAIARMSDPVCGVDGSIPKSSPQEASLTRVTKQDRHDSGEEGAQCPLSTNQRVIPETPADVYHLKDRFDLQEMLLCVETSVDLCHRTVSQRGLSG